MTILQLLYGLNTYDHVTCMHFHHPLNMTLSIMNPIDITSCAIRLSLYKYYFHYFMTIVHFFNINFPLHCNSQHHVTLQTYQTIKFIEGESFFLK
jgi:hypothetical protein